MLVQPADVSWNKPFKALYTELYEAWLADPTRGSDVTAAGNPRAPSRIKMVEWIKEAWAQIPLDVIKASFNACGITSNDPDVIHCTKSGGVAEASREYIQNLDANDVDLDLTCQFISDDDSSRESGSSSESDSSIDIGFHK